MAKCFDACSDTPLTVNLGALEWDWAEDGALLHDARPAAERAEPRGRPALEAAAALVACLPAVPQLAVLGRGALVAVLLGAGLTPLGRRQPLAPLLHLALVVALVRALLGASQAAVSAALHAALVAVRAQRGVATRAHVDGGLCALAVVAALAACLTADAQARLVADVVFALLTCATLAGR